VLGVGLQPIEIAKKRSKVGEEVTYLRTKNAQKWACDLLLDQWQAFAWIWRVFVGRCRFLGGSGLGFRLRRGCVERSIAKSGLERELRVKSPLRSRARPRGAGTAGGGCQRGLVFSGCESFSFSKKNSKPCLNCADESGSAQFYPFFPFLV
jgi:hypothetical protein